MSGLIAVFDKFITYMQNAFKCPNNYSQPVMVNVYFIPTHIILPYMHINFHLILFKDDAFLFLNCFKTFLLVTVHQNLH